MPLNSQHKRVSKNRVSITYDVETNGAVETKELPFVVGVIGDYSGHREDKEAIEERTFYSVDKDNFDTVMKRVGPKLNLKVDNVLADDDSQFEANLTFSSMKDFEPEAIVEQVEPLKKLVETRNQLKVLLSKADRSRDLEKLLKEVLQSADTINALSSELGISQEGAES
ncbi:MULTISPECIES: type VI secretion system contractile sheath small subunit [Vibrio]|uniref:Type VI secretion system family protein n=1 Tax=Vibrio proteolyticus NBRC 13287 TaxID=1219065 RepID=U2ZIK7_VIBPR|nr:type VI secretion system contractile sheath small subunit [Vibrio proteolyticus]NAW59573.1 type VI secretion system contractile sheath small subunit [Vibrio sp. V36_P2S2PM302]NAX22324.1 type VI secretion system contractile sheath small subunit [Vibrio sp. V39_P1S14PM300]NAX24271.1 type VI secretion system contractile sheath small subunit [Vibrio sp. V38_P2S17PM301]NAX32129.1 type VI secretion system contractile sheath small subunit [Vibrio sp. V37_P2S8PM304]GAD67606.1 type VI secretion syst